MFNLIPLIVLAFAAYRITRFLLIDILPKGPRDKFHTWLINNAQKEGKLKNVWWKLYELTSCTWCFGFWVSLALYWGYLWISPVYWTRFDWVSVFAIAGLQGLIHAFEPGDE